MNKKDMHQLRRGSSLIVLASFLISSLSTALLHIYSGANRATSFLPLGFIIAEFIFNLIVSFTAITAIHCHLQKRYHLDDHQKRFNHLLLILLVSALSFSLPFRSSAEIIRGQNGLSGQVFLICFDGTTAVGTCLLFIFLWTYPSVWAGTSEGTVISYKAAVCTLYAVLRFAISFAFRIHFEPLPVQHLFSLISILIQLRDEGMKPLSLSLILSVCAFEVILICCIYWNYSSSSASLCKSNDPSKQQSIIALWYYSSAVVFLGISIAVAAVARLLSPATQAINFLQQTSVVLLSSPIGNSAISLAVLSYALREMNVHSYTEEVKVPFILSPFVGSFSSPKQEEQPKEEDGDLLYRIADERDPQNEDPIPQPNVFSFESAILLFNTSWLATTYGKIGVKPLTPSDFGRPMSAVRAVVSDANNAVTAVILEKMDRFIIAFKPVLPATEEQSALRLLSKTDLGKTIYNPSEDQELLPLTKGSDLIQQLLTSCKVHHGFSKAYSVVQRQLHAHIQDLTMDTTRPLYITGFGSGGALASICAFDFSFRKVSETNAVSLYTYGSPRVMNGDMIVLFEKAVRCRWRCVVAGDSNTVKPSQASYGHSSKVATFTRSGHLALEWDRVYKWWQSEISAYPMHKISAYFCAFAKWHQSYHSKGSIDLWDWHIDPNVGALFQHESAPSDIMITADFMLKSPVLDVEAKSLRTLGKSANWPTTTLDEVVAFKR